MANPAIHAVIVVVAIIVPGGLLAYFAWKAYKTRQAFKIQQNEADPIEEIRGAFRDMYPPESLRAKEKRKRLNRYKLRSYGSTNKRSGRVRPLGRPRKKSPK